MGYVEVIAGGGEGDARPGKDRLSFKQISLGGDQGIEHSNSGRKSITTCRSCDRIFET